MTRLESSSLAASRPFVPSVAMCSHLSPRTGRRIPERIINTCATPHGSADSRKDNKFQNRSIDCFFDERPIDHPWFCWSEVHNYVTQSKSERPIDRSPMVSVGQSPIYPNLPALYCLAIARIVQFRMFSSHPYWIPAGK